MKHIESHWKVKASVSTSLNPPICHYSDVVLDLILQIQILFEAQGMSGLKPQHTLCGFQIPFPHTGILSLNARLANYA